MRYTEKSTRNLMSLAALVVAIMLVAVLAVGCGGGSSPTAPKPTPGPTPTPVTPMVTFVAATPPCGSTIRGSDWPAITFRVQYATNVDATITVDLFFADGLGASLLNDGATGLVSPGSGFVNVVTGMASRTGQTETVGITMRSGKNGPVIATATENCSFILQ